MRRLIAAVVSIVAVTLAGSLAVIPATAAEIAQSSVVNADPANYTPHVLDGEVTSIAQVGNLIILGGSFTQVRNAADTQTIARRNVVAFDATTGQISAFDPSPDGAVTTVVAAADGASVYLGGSFNTVSGQTRRKLAKVDLATGANSAGFRNVAGNGVVKDLRLVGDKLWVAGAFTTMSGSTQGRLITLNAATGNPDSYMTLAVAGQHNGGTTAVTKIDVTADGSRLVGIGNFLTVDGQSRRQIFMLDIGGASATVANWQTNFYNSTCASVFDTYMRDLDFAPDGSYFVVSTTGGYGGSTSACDTQARFNTERTGTGIAAEWVNTTGGDTTYAVEVTGAAVYVGGHFRWANNPSASDRAGAGAVARDGIAALDPANGMPLSWNPGRTRGVGVFDMLATSTGLWVASDTDRIGNSEYHGRIAFFPLAGGTTIPATYAPSLPAGIVSLGPTAGPNPSSVSAGTYFRFVSVASGLCLDVEGGSSSSGAQVFQWACATSGGDNQGWALAPRTDGSVNIYPKHATSTRLAATSTAAGTKAAILSGAAVVNDRWEVRTNSDETITLYNVTANRCLASDAGTGSGTPMRLQTCGSTSAQKFGVRNFAVDPTAVGLKEFSGTAVGRSTLSVGANNWSTVRAAVMLNGNVYFANSDGTFVRRSFDGTTWGSPVTVNTQDQLVQLTAWRTNVTRLTGVFFDKGRIYYTQTNDSSLKSRYFTAENDVVGASEFSQSSVTGLSLSQTRGMFLAGEYVFLIQSNGSLVRVGWQNGAFVAGTVATVSGPAIDGVNWTATATFAYQGTDGATANFAPVASASAVCTDQSCAFSSATSSDAGGSIDSYLWNFGDGTTSTEANPTHVYASSGTYGVTLTVTDNAGASSSTTLSKQVQFVDKAPVASFTASCDNRACSFDASASTDAEGPLTEYTWTFGDGATASGSAVSHTYAGDGDFTATLSVKDSAGQVAQSSQTVHAEYVYAAPVAVYTSTCESLTCSFDATTSADADGPLTGYSWNFGDGSAGTGATVEHTFAGSGSYQVTLTVTDSQGVQAQATQTVSPMQLAEKVAFVGAASTNRNATTQPVAVPTPAQVGDLMILIYSSNATTTTVTPPAGWAELAAPAPSGISGRVWTKIATAADIGATVTATSSTIVKADATLLVYRGVDPAQPIGAVASAFGGSGPYTTPAVQSVQNGLVVSYWAVKSNVTNSLTAPSGVTNRTSSAGTGSANITAFAGDTGPLVAGPTGEFTASAAAAGVKAFLLSVVLRPAS